MLTWSQRLSLLLSWGGIVFATVLLAIATLRLIPSSVRQMEFQRERIEQLERQLARTEHEIEVKRKFLDKLHTNPAFLERVARERLRYVRPDETIIQVQP